MSFDENMHAQIITYRQIIDLLEQQLECEKPDILHLWRAKVYEYMQKSRVSQFEIATLRQQISTLSLQLKEARQKGEIWESKLIEQKCNELSGRQMQQKQMQMLITRIRQGSVKAIQAIQTRMDQAFVSLNRDILSLHQRFDPLLASLQNISSSFRDIDRAIQLSDIFQANGSQSYEHRTGARLRILLQERQHYKAIVDQHKEAMMKLVSEKEAYSNEIRELQNKNQALSSTVETNSIHVQQKDVELQKCLQRLQDMENNVSDESVRCEKLSEEKNRLQATYQTVQQAYTNALNELQRHKESLISQQQRYMDQQSKFQALFDEKHQLFQLKEEALSGRDIALSDAKHLKSELSQLTKILIVKEREINQLKHKLSALEQNQLKNLPTKETRMRNSHLMQISEDEESREQQKTQVEKTLVRPNRNCWNDDRVSKLSSIRSCVIVQYLKGTLDTRRQTTVPSKQQQEYEQSQTKGNQSDNLKSPENKIETKHNDYPVATTDPDVQRQQPKPDQSAWSIYLGGEGHKTPSSPSELTITQKDLNAALDVIDESLTLQQEAVKMLKRRQ